MTEHARQHHVDLAPGDVGRYVLLPGDPGRSSKIAARFDAPRKVAVNREYETWTGTLDGVPVSVTSTGIGGPSSAIAVEELTAIGADTFVRVGTAGSMQPHVGPGDVVVVTAAIRDEGTSSHYLPIEFPAVGDVEVTLALAQGARSTGANVLLGVSQSKDSFYGQHAPERMPIAARLKERWTAWEAGGALCSEMEASAIYIVASTLGVRASGIMLVGGRYDRGPLSAAEEEISSMDRFLDTAIAGLRNVIAADKAQGRS